MSQSWAIEVSGRNLHRVGDLRLIAEIDAAWHGNSLWIRGNGLDETMYRRLAPVADGPVFGLDHTGRLTPFARSVPVRHLPELSWIPIAELLVPELPVARAITFRLPHAPLQLVRSANEQSPGMLLTDWDSFAAWALAAPEIRIRVCQFAVCQDEGHVRVAVRANPLPPLPGQRFWIAERVAIPLGYEWTPHVDAETLFEVLTKFSSTEIFVSGPAADISANSQTHTHSSHAANYRELTSHSVPESSTPSLWLWQQDGKRDQIATSEFIPTSRTNVRATQERLRLSVPLHFENHPDPRRSTNDGGGA